MYRLLLGFVLLVGINSLTSAQTMTLSTSNTDYQITNVFSDVDIFNFNIEINVPLAPGNYINPDIVSVTYQVQGALAPGTPSNFPAFNLQRTITGADFYAQGSSLSFEIAQSAVLTDGVQIAELVGNGIVFTFNGREIDQSRYHPALFELNADGTGRIQNSNNIHTLDPLVEVAFGEEYINDLMFDPGNTTLITGVPVLPPIVSNSGGGTTSLFELSALLLLVLPVVRRRRTSRVTTKKQLRQEPR